MYLPSRIFLIGGFIICLQFASMYAFFHYEIYPKSNLLEKSLVTTNLQRANALLKKELANLEQITRLFATTPFIQTIISSSLPAMPENLLMQQMIDYQLNLVYILDNSDKVLWQNIIDLNSQQAYPSNSFLANLWEIKPTFLENAGLYARQTGIYNGYLGPILLASVPIPNKEQNGVQGTLIIGKLITPLFLKDMQNLLNIHLHLWPLEGATLSKKHQAIINQLKHSDKTIDIEETDNSLRGFMSLADIDSKAHLLIFSRLNREFTALTNSNLFFNLLILTVPGLILLLAVLYLFHRKITTPTTILVNSLLQSEKNWQSPPRMNASEIQSINDALNHYLVRQQARISNETTQAYRQGMYLARQEIWYQVEETIAPLVECIKAMEQKLSNLPTNDIEWIIIEGDTRPANLTPLAAYTEQLQTINTKLRDFQRQTRKKMYELYSRTFRNIALLRSQARSLDPAHQFTPINSGNPQSKVK